MRVSKEQRISYANKWVEARQRATIVLLIEALLEAVPQLLIQIKLYTLGVYEDTGSSNNTGNK